MKYACPMPWSHAKLNVQGHISPCCLFDDTPEDGRPDISDGIQNSINSDYMKNIRERMLAGENLPECHRCYSAEKNGVPSQRTTFTEMGWDKYIGGKPKVRFLETAFSTHCNLACRMCGEEFSSKWKLINNPKKSPETSITSYSLDVYDCDLSELEIIKILGGEPFLSKEHDEFLERIIEKSNNPSKITLVYHTNGTIFPKQHIIDMWKKLKKVKIDLSIDGHGKLNEYLRPGHKWETIEENIDKFKELGVQITNQAVIHNLNIMHIVDFCHWQMKVFGELQSLKVLDIPEHMSIRNMSDELKERAIQELDKMVSIWPWTKEFSDWAKDTMSQSGIEQSWRDMSKQHRKLDQYFSQNFFEHNK